MKKKSKNKSKQKEKNLIITNNIKEVIKKIKNYINKSKKPIVFGFPGGRSVQILFNELKKEDIDWKKVHIFLVDERIVPLHHEESNFNMLKNKLLNTLTKEKGLPEKNIHPFDIEKHDINSYTSELKKFGYFDIAIFGVGEDCHICALFPNHHSIKNNSKYFIEINDSPKLPKNRMTSTKSLVLKTKLGIFLFIGKEKKQAFEKFLDKKTKINECPAKLAYKINSIILQID
ncbi:MAG: 6-phosphogluconolactonase [Candidatus Woesearchaeota archaeon]